MRQVKTGAAICADCTQREQWVCWDAACWEDAPRPMAMESSAQCSVPTETTTRSLASPAF